MEPGGIWKWGPRWRSIFLACDTVNVDCWLIAVKQMIPEAHTGTILIKHFSSSICWMLQRFQWFVGEPSGFSSPSTIIAALFRHLKWNNYNKNSYNIWSINATWLVVIGFFFFKASLAFKFLRDRTSEACDNVHFRSSPLRLWSYRHHKVQGGLWFRPH